MLSQKFISQSYTQLNWGQALEGWAGLNILFEFGSIRSQAGGGGHSNDSVVHMQDKRNQKKGCFLRLNVICANHS